MKKFGYLLATLLVLGAFQLSAKAADVHGFIYQDTKTPETGSGSVKPCRSGCSECTSYFGIVALGDCSIATAMKNGNISSLSHVDTVTKNILGYKKVTVKAYGQ